MVSINDIISDEVALFEMANLRAEHTGLKGIVYISSKQGSHGPRVKYFKKAGDGQPSFTVSISQEPILLANTMDMKTVNRMLPKVQKFVEMNVDDLQYFWQYGHLMSPENVVGFIGRLKKSS